MKTNPPPLAEIKPAEHKLCLIVNHVPPTNTKPARLKIHAPRFEVTRFISVTHLTGRDSQENAQQWLASKGVFPDSFGDLGNSFAIFIPWSQREALFSALGIKETPTGGKSA